MKKRRRLRIPRNNHEGFKALCRALCLSVFAIGIGFAAHVSADAQLKLDPMGGLGGNHFEYVCGPGRVLVALKGYAGVWIDNVPAVCARLEVVGVSARVESAVFGGNRPLNSYSTCFDIST